MLRLIKKHLAACKKKSEKDWKCAPKSAGSRVVCPFYVVGPDPTDKTAPRIKQHTNTGDERLAKAFLLEFELSLYQKPTPEPPPPVPPKTLTEAVEHFVATKKHRSRDRQQKLRRQLALMCGFLRDRFKRHHVTDVQKTDLESFMSSWEGKYTTLKTSRENLKSFWKYCFDSDFIPKNIAAALPTVGDERALKARRIPTLTPDEVETIINAASKSEAIFKREGEKVAKQGTSLYTRGKVYRFGNWRSCKAPVGRTERNYASRQPKENRGACVHDSATLCGKRTSYLCAGFAGLFLLVGSGQDSHTHKQVGCKTSKALCFRKRPREGC